MRTGLIAIVLLALAFSLAHAQEEDEEGAATFVDWLAGLGVQLPAVGLGMQMGAYQPSLGFWNDEFEAEGSNETFGIGAAPGFGFRMVFGRRLCVRLDAGRWASTVSADVTKMETETGFSPGTDEVGITLIPITVAGQAYPWGLKRWAWCPYLGAGGGPCRVKRERTRTVGDSRTIVDEGTGGGFLACALVGVERQLSYRLSLSAEARYAFGQYVQQKLVGTVAEDRDVSLAGPQFDLRMYLRIW